MSTVELEPVPPLAGPPTPDTPPKTGWRDLWAVRPFRNLWMGQAISQLGDALYWLVFLFMVDQITGDERMVGLTGVAQSIPFLLLSPHAGVVADRGDRRAILLRADVLSFLFLAAFGLYVWYVGTPPAWTLIAAGATMSTINVYFAPAKSAAIPQLVPPHLLTTANALSLTTQNLVPLFGLALSGTVLAALYALSPSYFFAAAIGLNAVSFAVSAYYVRRLPPLVAEQTETEQKGLSRAIADVRDGLRYVRSHQVLWVMLLLNTAVWLAFAPFMIVYVKVNRDWFGGAYSTLALCEVSFFLGVILCSVFIERLNIQRVGRAFIWGSVGLGTAVVFMSVSRHVWAYSFWNFLCGLSFPFVQIPMTGYIQRIVPDQFQGRVNSVLAMAGMGLQPLGIGLGAWVLALVGPAWMHVLMGGIVVAAALIGLSDRAFRDAR